MDSIRFILSILLLCALSFIRGAASTPGPDQLATDLGAAVENGDAREVRRLLDEGADPNRRVPGNNLDCTALFLAVKGDDPTITRVLLEAGADPRIEDENGDPVMVYAADAGRAGHAKLLIEHGVGIDSRSSQGRTCLMRGARYENTQDIRAKLDLGADPDLTTPQGHTPLMLAAESGNAEAVKALLEGGATVGLTDPGGRTALMVVAAREAYSSDGTAEAKIINLLIKAGADIDRRDAEGNTALFLALDNWTAKPPMIEALLAAKPDLSIRNAEGRDALYLAVAGEDTSVFFNRLVGMGADIRTTDDDDVGLLMLAAGNADEELVAELLKRGLDPNRLSKGRQNAVHRVAGIYFYNRRSLFRSKEREQALANTVPSVLELLHQSGAVVTLKDQDGDTPLHLAAMAGNVPALKWLASRYPRWDEENRKGETPLHLAATSGPVENVELLLAKAANIDQPDPQGQTPLSRAVAVEDRSIIKLLVEQGADINRKDANDSTILAHAVGEGKLDLARFLVDLGADPQRLSASAEDFRKVVRQFHDTPTDPDDYAFGVGLLAARVEDIDAPGRDGVTPLMWVASSNVLPALDAILKRGPKLDARSKDGRTALMWAATSGADDTFARLAKAGADVSLKDRDGRTAADWREWFTRPQVAGGPAAAMTGEPFDQQIERVRRDALREYVSQGRYFQEDRIAGSDPLHLAAALGEIDALKALLDAGVEIDRRMPDSTTALMEAAANGRVAAIRFLLDQGADPTLRDSQRRRPLDHAVNFDHLAVAEILMKLPGVIGDDELQLLDSLVAHGDADLLRDFLDAGVKILPADRRPQGNDIYERPRYRAGSPLNAAAVHEDDSLLKVLAEYPAATGAAEPELLGVALHRAADAGRLANVRFLIEVLKVDPGVEVEDSFGGVTRIIGSEEREELKPLKAYTALSRALEEGHDSVVKFLLEKGAKPTGRTRSGAPPVTFAVIHRRMEMLETLLESGAALEVVDFSGLTALHHAAEMNDRMMIGLLLKHGADPEATDQKGRTPLDRARGTGAEQAVEMLSK